MAKSQKSQQLHANRGEVRIQNTQIDDDNFLPPAEEIAKYHLIDPTILDYITKVSGLISICQSMHYIDK